MSSKSESLASARPSPLLRVHQLFDRALTLIENAAVAIAAIAMLAAMVLTSLDAVMRYAFSAPISFQQYLTENYLLVAMVNMALAWGFRMGGYIRIETMLTILPRRLANGAIRLGLLVSAAYVAALAWMAWGTFWEAYVKGSTHFGEIDWPVSWSWVWIPVGCGLLALRLLLIATGPADKFAIGKAGEDPV